MRVGLFGGTFDPPHLGHLIAAQDALEELGLDRVRFVPAQASPFKTEDRETSPSERLAMVEAAIAGHDDFELCRDELDRPAPSYTIDTVRALRAAEPEVELTLLIGVDQWASLARWRDPLELATLARLAVLAREGQDPTQVHPGLEVDWMQVDVTRIDISSSQIRARRRAGRSIRYLVPDAVRTLIESKGLYVTC